MEEKNSLEEISDKLSTFPGRDDIKKRIVKSVYLSALGDYKEKGIGPSDGYILNTVKEAFGMTETTYFEREVIEEIFEELIEIKDVESTLYFIEVTDRHVYAPKDLVKSEYVKTLDFIRDFVESDKTIEFCDKSRILPNGTSYGWSTDTISEKIEYIKKIRDNFDHIFDCINKEIEDNVLEIYEDLVSKTFSVESLRRFGKRDFVRYGINYAIELEESTGIKIKPETMQKGFEHLLKEGCINEIKKIAEKTGIKPKKEIFEKYISEFTE